MTRLQWRCEQVTRRTNLLFVFLVFLTITLVAAGDPDRAHSESDGVEMVINEPQEMVIHEARELNYEEWVEWLHQTGLQEKQVDLLVEYDRQVELAHQNGASREVIERLTDQLNERMREEESKSEEGGGTLPGWTSSTKYIYATCQNGPTASFRIDTGDWYSMFKRYSGTYAVTDGYCDLGPCDRTHAPYLPDSWEYHTRR